MLAQRMKHAIRLLSLWLVLLAAQQGSVVHELSHLCGSTTPSTKIDAGGIDKACVLCPAFAQATSPGFSPSFHLPVLARIAPQPIAAPLFVAINAAVPRPRSRGPPV